ncbi:hypothetical protein FACS189413_00320 [Bacteroidia bacterium]|nr:hypothetical protein FACS189413_00320 [Bacteroidia bacterium]
MNDETHNKVRLCKMKNTTPPLWLNITPLTKLWHFSPVTLEELLSEEVQFGTYKIPEII